MPAELLASSPRFSALGGGLAAVASAARSVELARNDVLFDEGDGRPPSTSSSGASPSWRAGESGRESVVAFMEHGRGLR